MKSPIALVDESLTSVEKFVTGFHLIKSMSHRSFFTSYLIWFNVPYYPVECLRPVRPNCTAGPLHSCIVCVFFWCFLEPLHCTPILTNDLTLFSSATKSVLKQLTGLKQTHHEFVVEVLSSPFALQNSVWRTLLCLWVFFAKNFDPVI